MTIALSDNTPRVSYTVAEGVTQTAFTVTFEFFDDADLNFYVDGTLKTLTTHYTVTGGDGSTGTINTTAGNSVTGIAGGSTVVITRSIALERTTDFPSSGAFEVATLNTELDRFTAIAAEISDDNDRSIHLADDDATVSMTLPSKANRLGRVLGFNATTGAVEAGPTIADVSSLSAITADISTLADIEDGTDATDAIQTVAGISGDVTTVAGIESNVTTVAGQTTNLQNVTDNLSAIQNASTNATNASNSASAAAASAAAAALSADTFDDTYLGAKASDPSVDNDGDALNAGDLYFNTTSNNLKVYTGSAWADAALTAADFLTVANNLSDLGSAATARTNLGLGTAATSASTDFVAVTGDAMTGDLTLGDNNKAIFGAGSDLQIYHDGSSSYIDDTGTGVLYIRGDASVRIGKAGTTEVGLRVESDSYTKLYYDNSEKLATTSTGIQVTGTALATTDTDTTNTGNVTLDFGANQNFVLTLTGNVTLDNPSTEQVGQSGFITFIQDGTGGRTVSLGTDYETAGGAGLTLSSAASATDIVPYIVVASGRILLGTPQLAFS